MAEEKEIDVTKEKSVTLGDEKTPVAVETETTVAPASDKPAESDVAPEAEDITEVLGILNVMDELSGGKGGIKALPPELQGSVKYLIEKLKFIRELHEDPLYKAILDELADQKEDGKTPSVEVAIARAIPLERLQEIADSEDYEGVQTELAGNLEASKQAEADEAMLEESFVESQKAGDEYAAEMGYDEAQKDELFKHVLELFQVMGDGKLTVEEWRKVDKMRNYDKDTEDLRSQIPSQATKEVLPDQASMDIASQSKPAARPMPSNTPGLGSMGAYDNVGEDIANVGKRRFVK